MKISPLPSPTTPAFSPQATSTGGAKPAALPTCSTAIAADTWLRDNPTDASTDAMVQNILALRAKARAGEEITEPDMLPYSDISGGNSSELFIDRDYFTEGFLPAIANAEKSIHIAMLAFDGGRVAHYVADLLIEKKQANPDLEIRVIADNLQSNALFPWSKGRKNLNRLKEAGIEVVFNNYFTEGMEHRKTIIVDSEYGFFGGSCIKDEYFGNEAYWDTFDHTVKTQGLQAARDGAFLPKTQRLNSFDITPAIERPEYGDFGLSLRGPAVSELQAGFLQSWLRQEQPLDPELTDAELREKYFTPLPCDGDLSIKLIRGIPCGHGEMQQSLLSIIEGAEKTLDIEMAYIHVAEFSDALVKAAERGVEICLISNSQEGIDAEFSWHINRQYYPRLLEAGIKLFELDKFSHRKFLVADKRVVFVSTGNPEFHSWQIAWDEIALIDSTDYAAEVLTRVIYPDLNPQISKKVSKSSLEQESRWTRIKTALLCFMFNLFTSLFRLLTNPNLANEKRVKLMAPAIERNQGLAGRGRSLPKEKDRIGAGDVGRGAYHRASLPSTTKVMVS